MSPTDPGFEKLLDFLYETHGFDFSVYKRTTLSRRIGKRVQALGLNTFDEYLDHLQVHPQEYHVLFDTVLINVTGFYRDKPTWDYLGTEIIPGIVARAGEGSIRVWSAGCATGEEAYTLAILFAEAMGVEAFRRQVKIYATDADEAALQIARAGSYPHKDLDDLPDEYAQRYFEGEGNRASFRGDLRRCVIFGRHDLAQDAPISRIDLLLCRNTLMYFTAPAQTHILNRLHYALNDDGYLVLGRAEMLLTHGNLFTPVELKHRVFGKIVSSGGDRVGRLITTAQTSDDGGGAAQARDLLIEQLPMPTVLVDADGIVQLANDSMRLQFGVLRRDIGRPFRDLEISYRPTELRSAIEDAARDKTPVTIRGVERVRSDGSRQYLDITLTPLFADAGLLGTVVSLTDVTDVQRLKGELSRSSQELETAYEELQSTNEELETTNEELQSTVEELETTNEELQSANEELETMNEELQSTNNELQSIVSQLRVRSDELDRANFFIDSVLMSMHFGVMVLGHDLKIRAWNRRNEDLWGLHAGEVTGHGLAELDAGLPGEEIVDAVRRCVSEDRTIERKADAINRRGRRIHCRIVCTPLRMPGDEPDGAVVILEELAAAEAS